MFRFYTIFGSLRRLLSQSSGSLWSGRAPDHAKQLELSNYELKSPEKYRHNVIIDESSQGDGEI